MLKLSALAVSLLLLTAANVHEPSRAAERALPIGASFDWNGSNPHLVHLRAGSLHVIVFSGLHDQVAVPMVRITAGSKSILVRGYDQNGGFARARVSVGRWDRAGHPFILVTQDMGGAHCCVRLMVFVAGGSRLSATDLGQWDGTTFKPVAKDLDGDGRPDFVLNDDRFLYRFASHAGSWAPPLILNVINGRVVDVSARPAFVAMFRRDTEKARPWCVRRAEDLEGPGACVDYLASAARAGHYREAWRDLLRTYDWKVPVSLVLCKSKPDPVRECSAERSVTFPNLPEAIRGFVKSLGYIN
jgi:hypothetical protein